MTEINTRRGNLEAPPDGAAGGGGRPATARARIIAGVDEYLALHARDPEAHPREKQSYGRWLGVSHGAIHQKHPAVEEALRRLVGRATSTSGQQVPGDEGGAVPLDPGQRPTMEQLRARGAVSLTDEDLARQIEQAVQETVWVMSRFVQQRKREDHVAHAPLVLHDLELAVAQLGRQSAALRPLVAERQRRETEVELGAERA